MKKQRKHTALWLLMSLLFTLLIKGSALAVPVTEETERTEAGIYFEDAVECIEIVKENGTEVLSAEDEELTITFGATADEITSVASDMKTKFSGISIKNTSKTDVTTYWNMLAAKSLGLSLKTETAYDEVDFGKLSVQKIAKFIIAMVNDGVNPGDYYIGNQDLVEFLLSSMGEDGGFTNASLVNAKTGKATDAATASKQATVLHALYVVGAEVPQKAADFLEKYQNEDGIISSSFGVDYDTTAWCMTGCKLLGLSYPNAAKAEKTMTYAIASMNANTFACYADYLSVCGTLSKADLSHMIDNYYDGTAEDISGKGFLYNNKVNALATSQSSIPLGAFISGETVYETLLKSGKYNPPSGDSIKVTVRIADALDGKTTDLLKRQQLIVEKGSSRVLTGVNDSFDTVTVADVLTEAVGAVILGHDPSKDELTENAGEINEKLVITKSTYGYGIEDLLLKGDNVGYYKNRTEMLWTVTDPVTAGDDLIYFLYDYLKTNYAVFDQAEYQATTEEAAKVTVSVQSYDADWNPVFTPAPAKITAVNGSKEETFNCDEKGTASLMGLSEGSYDLTAVYTDAYGMDIVSPYASLKVKKAEKKEEKKEEPVQEQKKETEAETKTSEKKAEDTESKKSSSGSYISYHESVKGYTGAIGVGGASALGQTTYTGTAENPVTDGIWSQSTDGSWSYRTSSSFKNCWAFISNPYAGNGQPTSSWFYFDENGIMLTGWQKIGDKWYYLNPASDGTLGACQLSGVTPDGYTVDASGAWVESILRVASLENTAAASATTEATKAASAQTSASETTSSNTEEKKGEKKEEQKAGKYVSNVVYVASSSGGSVSSGSSSGSGSSKTGKVSVSVSANVTTEEGNKVSFSGSKSYSLEEGETYTAYELLSMLCDDKGWELDGSSDYVSGVNGLSEFDCGSQSGWMYSVGGKYPNIPAGDYEVEKGKTVKWTYVTKYTATSD